MARRDKGGLAGDLFGLAAVLPWWVGVVMAALAYVLLHRYAGAEIPATAAPGQVGRMVLGQVLKSLATWGQYLLPLLLLAGATASAIGRRKRQGLIAAVAGDTEGAALRSMSWSDFEQLVGQAFRMHGYTVSETGGGGADGGSDLQLTKGGETFLVQCKQWKAYKVSVTVVRELYGVMAAQGAVGGFVVTSGVFTAQARAFAKGRNIELIDGVALKKMVDTARPMIAGSDGNKRAAMLGLVVESACPRCGSAMVQRRAQQGANTGKAFLGCSAFPQCRGVRALE